MKKSAVASWVIVLSFAAGSSWAADSNFKSSNMKGDAPAPEYSASRQAAREKKQEAREPGFWDREYERSGLKETHAGWRKSAENMGGVFNGNFLKEQEEKYRERHPSKK